MNENLKPETSARKGALAFSRGYADFNVLMNGKRVESVKRVILPELGPNVEALVLTLEFPSARSAAAALGSFREQRRIEVWAAEDIFFVAERKDEIRSLHWVMDAVPLSFRPGAVAAAAGGASAVRFRVDSYAAYLDGEPLWEADIPNGRCIVNGVDYSGEMYWN